MTNDFVLGLYVGAKAILDDPAYLPRLRDEIGLGRVIISYSGRLPESVATLSPFDGTPPSDACMRSLVCTHLDGQPITLRFESVRNALGPAISVQRDEETMRLAIQAAQAAGLRVWLLSEAWTTSDWDNLMYCPSHEGVNRWYEALYCHIASSYDVEGLDITHARYPMTSHPRGMFVCACERCAAAAATLGYDMARMKGDLYAALATLRGLSGRRLMELAGEGIGLSDYVQLLGLKSGVLDWFRYRADLLNERFARFRQAVHAAAGEDFIFGADTYPASLAFFNGHTYRHWGRMSDFASPLISHADIFQLHTLVVWAEFLQSLVPDLSEQAALRFVYRLVGYDQLTMPDRIEDFLLGDLGKVPGFAKNPRCEFEHVPLRALLRLDMAKARLYLPEGLPSYPIIQGGGAPHDWPRELVQGVIEDARELGHQGVMLQGTRSLLDD